MWDRSGGTFVVETTVTMLLVSDDLAPTHPLTLRKVPPIQAVTAILPHICRSSLTRLLQQQTNVIFVELREGLKLGVICKL